MSNFFAALEDSGDEVEQPKPKSKSKEIVVSNKNDRKSNLSSSNKAEFDRSRSDHHRQQERAKKSSSGQRSGRSAPREGKRAYDRRSGTGRGREIKKSGGGARNWGSDKNDARHAEGMFEGGSREEDEDKMKSSDTNGADVNQDEDISESVEGALSNVDLNADEETQPKEDKTMTYEEYLEERDSKRAESEAFKPLDVKEYEDDAFAGFAVKTKSGLEDETFIATGNRVKQPKKKNKIKAKNEKNKKIVPSFRVQDPNNSRRRRDNKDDRVPADSKQHRYYSGKASGNGRYYGDSKRDNRGSGRDDRMKEELNVADMNSFPTL